jgi:hypothetical protein
LNIPKAVQLSHPFFIIAKSEDMDIHPATNEQDISVPREKGMFFIINFGQSVKPFFHFMTRIPYLGCVDFLRSPPLENTVRRQKAHILAG